VTALCQEGLSRVHAVGDGGRSNQYFCVSETLKLITDQLITDYLTLPRMARLTSTDLDRGLTRLGSVPELVLHPPQEDSGEAVPPASSAE
jgi:hypothetical protein